MEKSLIRNSFAKALHTYRDNAEVQAHVAGRMLELIKSCGYCCGAPVLELGCGTGNFTKAFLNGFAPAEIVLNDICPDVETELTGISSCNVEFVCGDAETLDFPQGRFGLVVSCSAVQWFADPSGFMRRALEWLVPSGLLAVATYGSRNFEQLRQAIGVGLHYPESEEYVNAVDGMGEVLHISQEVLTKTFPDVLSLLRHLKYTGVNGIMRNNRMWTKGALRDLELKYPKDDSSEGFGLTYNPIYIVVRKR